MSIIVLGCGRTPSPVVFVGEAPGLEEAERGEPFVGRSGQEQCSLLARHGITFRHFYRTNVVKEFTHGNPDPTPEQIDLWTPVLAEEMEACQPQLVIAVGRFATRWFLGHESNLETCHGKLWKPGEFSSNPNPYRLRAYSSDCLILPIYHPALGFYDMDARGVIAWDYEQVAKAIKIVRSDKSKQTSIHSLLVRDELSGSEKYNLITGSDLELTLPIDGLPISIDTEGTEHNPWSIQVSVNPGQSYVVLASDPTFTNGINHLQTVCNRSKSVILHNAMWDMPVCLAMGLDLYNPEITLFDTMTAAYLLRLEPQGLKPLSRRWLGMRMRSYLETIGKISEDTKLNYIRHAASLSWPPSAITATLENDGTVKTRKPQGIAKRLEGILRSYSKSRIIDDTGIISDGFANTASAASFDQPVDLYSVGESSGSIFDNTITNDREQQFDLDHRWKQLPLDFRRSIESVCGPYPTPTLDSIPILDAVQYAGRDSDATLRLYYHLQKELESRDLARTMGLSMSVLPMFSAMQLNGMTADRSKLQNLSDEMTSKFHEFRSSISDNYFNGEPFNPNSPKHVRELLRKCGLRGTGYTATGEISTSKKSIQHLRFSHPAIEALFDAREHAHIRDTFCEPTLDRIPSGHTLYPIRCSLKITRTTSRRLASANPNLLAIPSRTEIGKAVRACYVAPDGYMYGGADLSQIEVRVMAHHSQDPLLCRLLREGADVHQMTASRIFGIPQSDVTSEQRTAAKTIKFGIMYGMQAKSLHTQLMTMGILKWSIEDCEQMISDYLSVYTGIRDYILKVARETAATGYSRTTGGMYRYIPGIWSLSPAVRAESIRVAVSQRIQGDAQEMIQSSMVWIWSQIYPINKSRICNIRPCLQIHDEVIFLFPVEWEEFVKDIVLEGLTQHTGLRLRVPVKASWKSGHTWEDLK